MPITIGIKCQINYIQCNKIFNYLQLNHNIIYAQVEDEEVPYFQSLRGEALESSKIIFRMATMIIWSPDVGGVVKMSDTAKPKLRRSQTERHIRKITPAARFISLQFPSRDS